MSQPCASLLALREVEAGGLKGTDDLASAALGRNGSPLCRSRRGTTRANFDDRGFRPGHEGRILPPVAGLRARDEQGLRLVLDNKEQVRP